MTKDYQAENERLRTLLLEACEPRYVYDEQMIAENKRLKDENEMLRSALYRFETESKEESTRDFDCMRILKSLAFWKTKGERYV